MEPMREATYSEMVEALWNKAINRKRIEYDHAPNKKGKTDSRAIPILKDNGVYVKHEGVLKPLNATSYDVGKARRVVKHFFIR